jgi:hypothetical protein
MEALQYKDDVEEAEIFVGAKLESAHQGLAHDRGVIIGDHACIVGDWIVKDDTGFVQVMSKEQYAIILAGKE